jgi:hypothetical protein
MPSSEHSGTSLETLLDSFETADSQSRREIGAEIAHRSLDSIHDNLTRVITPEAVRCLRPGLDDSDPKVRAYTVIPLRYLFSEMGSHRNPLTSEQEDTLRALLECGDDPNPHVRRNVLAPSLYGHAVEIALLPDEPWDDLRTQIVEVCVENIDHENPVIRKRAMELLADPGSHTDYQPSFPGEVLLEHPDPTSVVPTLVDRLSDSVGGIGLTTSGVQSRSPRHTASEMLRGLAVNRPELVTDYVDDLREYTESDHEELRSNVTTALETLAGEDV